MINVLGLALYGPLAASNRYRLSQYISGLREKEINLNVCPLLGNNYLYQKFNYGTVSITSVFISVIKRLIDLSRQSNYDVIILHCELVPFLPGYLEKALIRKPYIYDFDDAFYLKYANHSSRIVRRLLGKKFEAVLKGASAVSAGNSTLYEYADKLNANVKYLPTVVDTSRYISKPLLRSQEIFTVGWVGSPSTAPYLLELVTPLSNLGKAGPINFVVIGAKAPLIPNVNVVELPWSEDTEIDLINSFDVGIMPLPSNDWAKGKCAFKLIQYMACGIPVIASPIGANVDVVSRECGLMATTPAEWESALTLLRDNPRIRSTMGNAGRERVEEKYSLDKNLPRLVKIINEVAKK